jgi:nucleosome binding factor SPN SPT16 subunit
MSFADWPAQIQPRKNVYVDVPNNSVFFPINDQMVPFHVSTISRAHKQDENGWTVLSVKFIVPETAAVRAKMKVQKGKDARHTRTHIRAR